MFCYLLYAYCSVSFLQAPVYIYYGLDNFYQNHRRYVKSRDDTQLLGEVLTKKDLNKDCAPYRWILSALQHVLIPLP